MTQIIYIFQHITEGTAVTVTAGSREDAFNKLRAIQEDASKWEVIDSFIAHPSRY